MRETVNQTGGWFSYRYTSELYPYRPHAIYPDLVELAGENKVIESARGMLADGKLEQALMQRFGQTKIDPGRLRPRTIVYIIDTGKKPSITKPKNGSQQYSYVFFSYVCRWKKTTSVRSSRD